MRLLRVLVAIIVALLSVPAVATWVAAAPGDEPTTSTTTEPAPVPTDPPTTAPTTSATPTTTSTPPDAPTTSAAPPAVATTTTTTRPPLAPGGDQPVVATTTTEPGFVILLTPDPTNTIAIDKTNTADGEPARDDTSAQPGDSWTYNLLASCSSINVDCVNLTVVDTFPADVIIDETSFSTTCADVVGLRDVTYVAATRTLTILYVQPLANPPGSFGKVAGTSDNCVVRVTLPADTPLEDGAVIANEATISASNVADSATDPSDVIVDVPRTVAVNTTKAFTDPSAIAGDPNATTTMQLGSTNQSSNSAEVQELVIEDSTAATYDYLDVEQVTVTQFPTGAAQAQLFVCPAPGPCTADTDWVPGGTATPPAPAVLDPTPTDPGDIVGVRVVFTAADGSFIENETTAGPGATASVEIDMSLRDTVRSTGQPIVEIPSTTVVNNIATSTVTDPGAGPTTATDSDTAQYQILPPTLSITPSKTFFPDANGNYQTDPGEHAVIGESSGVSMIVNATNASAFPISQIVITEPGAEPPLNEFEKFDPDSIRLTFPAGAANANVVVTYEDGSTTTNDYPAPGPGDVALHPPAAKVTSITVTYTGDPAVDGGNTIQPGATAGLGVHGNLNDLVDGSDVGGGGTIAGIDNCADVDAAGTPYPGGTGSAAGTACAQLPIEERNADTGGTKVPSQGEVPADEPVLFTMTTSNNGNLPLIDLIVADPPTDVAGGVPPTPDVNSVWYWGMFVGADVQPASMASRVTIEVYTVADGWQPLPPDSPPTGGGGPYPDVIGVRASIDVLNPTESFDFRVGMISRIPLPPGTPPATLTNCYGVTATTDNGFGEYDAETYCSPPIVPGPVVESAAINKAISPETLPKRIPGMTPQNATVTLQIRNTGTIVAQYLQITDNDAGDTQPADFWDAVDFVGISSIQAPAAGALRDADRVQIDAFVDADGAGPGAGSWVNGTPTPIGSPSVPVTNAQVRGLRFTFSDTSTLNDGFVLTPCDGADVTCAGIVEFQVQPRLTLVSTGAPIPDTDPCPDPDISDTVCSPLLNSATGAFTTRLHPDPTDPATIDEVTDDLFFVPGDPALDVNKTPENATAQPGTPATFNLSTTNSGTANLPDVTVADPVPDGILFDDSYVDPATGLPFTVTWTNLPAGYLPPPVPTFVTTADPSDPTRVGFLRWTFEGWEMPPNASVNILYRYTLAPGVTAGQQITNTMGASSPVDGLTCSDPNDGEVTDGDFGERLYCTDPANVTVAAGANFAARKWVAGNPDLGWYNVLSGEPVPIGGDSCLSLEANGRTYTTNPCIALVEPGEQFHYVLRVQNAGTESALDMTIVDTFPAPGDTGVFGADRGTQWANAPTMAGPAVFNGPSTGTLAYESAAVCIEDLYFDRPPCPAGTWDDGWEGSHALRMTATFAPAPLPPGGTVDVYFSMTAPIDVPRVADPTIAWNSIAHGEVTDIGNGARRVLAPLEPLKVGVATMYGTLEVVKEIGDNPAVLPLDDVEFTFTYDCTTAGDTPWPVGGPGTVTATPTTPGLVTGIPAGSTCEVTETGTNGGIPDPASTTVFIEPSTDPDTPIVTSTTFTNDFPLGEIEVVKDVTGFAIPGFTSGPYPITVECTFLGETVPGFPVDEELLWNGTVPVPVTIEAPVGSACTVVETGDNGATTVTYDPPNADGTAAEVTVPSESGATVEVTITNDFPFGAFDLLKVVTGDVDPAFWDPDLTGEPFLASVTCTFNGLTVPGFPVEVELVPGEVSDPITAPVGSVCTAIETDDRGTVATGGEITYDPPNADGTAAEITVTVGSDADPMAITITDDFGDGGLQVTKTIGVNDADLDLDDVEYTFEYECTFDPGDGSEITFPDPSPGELIATVNDPAEVDGLPAGAVCTVEETDSRGGIPSAPVTVTIVAGTILEPYTPAPFTNDYPTGRAELVKLVAGDAQDEFTGGPYAIAVDCVAVGQTESFPGFPLVVEVVPNVPVGTELPVGTTCVFEELDVPEGVTATYDPANPDGPGGLVVVPPVEPPPDEEPIATVSVTNTFTTGSLVITKEVSGPGAPAFSQGPFVFGVTCDYQGVEDVYAVAVVVPGSPDGSPVESEPVTGLPIGATCTVTEIDDGGADIVTPPQTVTIEENEQANVAFVGVNNPFSAGTISIVKRVDGSAAASAPIQALRYPIRVQCAVAGTGGELVTVLDRTVTVAGDGVPVPVTDDAGNPALVPLGARCWGSETNPAGATRVVVDHDSYANGAEVVASDELQPLQITVTNTFDAAQLAVTKQAVNAPDSNATYSITVTCTVIGPAGTPVPAPLLSGSSPLTLRAGQTVTVTTLAGARCVVAEPNAGSATVTLRETGGSDADATDGIVTLVGARGVVVTNTFPGALPSTGGGATRALTEIAGLLVAAGSVLLAGRMLGRRRARA